MTGIEWSCWRDVEYGGGGLSLTAARPASHKPRLVTSKESDDSTTFFTDSLAYYSPRQCFKRLGAILRHGWTYVRSPAFDPAPPSVEQLETSRQKRKPIKRGCAKQATLIVKPVCSGCIRCWREKHKVCFTVLFFIYFLCEFTISVGICGSCVCLHGIGIIFNYIEKSGITRISLDKYTCSTTTRVVYFRISVVSVRLFEITVSKNSVEMIK